VIAQARPISAASLLADQQKKHSDCYQQGKQSTDSQRQSPVATIKRFRASAFLRCSNTKPEEKVAHCERSAHRSQLKLMYGDHHQQIQNDCRYDELDP
jgi:hypothetical protein